MSLEFNKLIEQVHSMGRFLGHMDSSINAKLALALEWFYAADDLEAAQKRIDLIRKSSVSGYRGGAPVDEVLCETFPRRCRAR